MNMSTTNEASRLPTVVFKHDVYGSVRAVEFENKLWLVCKDLAVMLGYKDAKAAIHSPTAPKNKMMTNISGPRGNFPMVTADIDSTCAWVRTCRKPRANGVHRWLRGEITAAEQQLQQGSASPAMNEETTVFERNANTPQIFTSREFGSVRVVVINGEPWFVGRDVAKILRYKNANDALAQHVNGEDKGVVKCETPGGIQNLVAINESGLYSLILSSKLPSAQRFKHWVTSEVLPSIRKKGYYLPGSFADPSLKPDSYMIEDPVERAQRWIEEYREKEALMVKVEDLTVENKVLSGDTLGWKPRALINALIRSYAINVKQDKQHVPPKTCYAYAFADFYKELYYRYGISLKARRKETDKTYLDALREDEMPLAVRAAAALCSSNGIDVFAVVGEMNFIEDAEEGLGLDGEVSSAETLPEEDKEPHVFDQWVPEAFKRRK